MRFSLLAGLCLLFLMPLSGCFIPVDATYGPGPSYNGYSCEQLRAEMDRLGQREDELKRKLGHTGEWGDKYDHKHHKQNYDNHPNDADELANVHNRLRKVHNLMKQNNCGKHNRRDPNEYGPYPGSGRKHGKR
ncbi:hypothetical protein LJC46_00085 [Desulfovibrio sp. OttesenSCG-928-G15]|nr:hypothetical protein [Desulfovibrio sp. OttesenSCG-928-G15]